MEREVSPSELRARIVHRFLDGRYKTIDNPQTVATIDAELQGLDLRENTLLASCLVATIASNRLFSKQNAALHVLKRQLQVKDQFGLYPVDKVNGEAVAFSVIDTLGDFSERRPKFKPGRTIDLLKEAVVILDPYIGDARVREPFMEACKQAGVYSEELEASNEDNKQAHTFLRTLRNNPLLSVEAVAAMLGIAIVVGYTYRDRFARHGLLPENRLPSWLRKEGGGADKAATEPKVLFERTSRGGLHKEKSYQDARIDVFLRYVLGTDDPIYVIAQKCGISRITGYGYYYDLIARGQVPADKIRKNGPPRGKPLKKKREA